MMCTLLLVVIRLVYDAGDQRKDWSGQGPETGEEAQEGDGIDPGDASYNGGTGHEGRCGGAQEPRDGTTVDQGEDHLLL